MTKNIIAISALLLSMPLAESKAEDYERVDLGLSVEWATRNLDASDSFKTGSYYRFGDIKAKSNASYPFQQNFSLDDITICGNPEYDAVTATLGDGWCTPTREMFAELLENCDVTQEFDDDTSTNYYKFTSNINGNSVIFPVCGYFSSAFSFMASGSTELYSLSSTNLPYDEDSSFDFVRIYTLRNTSIIQHDNEPARLYCTVRPVYVVNETVEVESITFETKDFEVKTGDEFDIAYEILPDNATNKNLDWSSSAPTCVTVDADGHARAVGVGVCAISATTSNGLKATCTVKVTTDPVDTKYVDMGTSVMWAECNLGASKASEEGNFYRLGEIIYDYRGTYALQQPLTGSRLCNDPRYDAATANLGMDWHTPTDIELQELIDNCTITRHTLDGVKGMLFTSKTTGNTLFIPGTGRKYWAMAYRYDEGAAMLLTSSWKEIQGTGVVTYNNRVLLDNAIVSESATHSQKLSPMENHYPLRPVYSPAVKVENIIFSPESASIAAGSYVILSPEVLPDDASCPNLEWESSDPTVATVQEYEKPFLRSAIVSRVAEGTCEIVAKTIDGSDVKAAFIVKLTTDGIEAIEINMNINYEVYDLNGRRIMSARPYNDIRMQLVPGLYILSGSDGTSLKIKL